MTHLLLGDHCLPSRLGGRNSAFLKRKNKKGIVRLAGFESGFISASPDGNVIAFQEALSAARM